MFRFVIFIVAKRSYLQVVENKHRYKDKITETENIKFIFGLSKLLF